MKIYSIPRKARDGEQTCLERPVVSKVEPSRKSRTILVSLIIALLAGTVAEAKYGGGSGTEQDPYLIYTSEQMNTIGANQDDWGKHFRLMADIDLSAYTGTQFKIIGNISTKFSGVFDGNDHKVRSFTWDSTSGSFIGLFGHVGGGGQIKNLGMEDVDVNAVNGSYLGGLCGLNQGGTIINCYATGNVNIVDTSKHIGGLCGFNNHGTIRGCYYTGNVTCGYAPSFLGGLCGENAGTISASYTTGTITGGVNSRFLGGLCGYNYYSTISDCFATGAVTGGDYSSNIGGLCGNNYHGTISDCFATGNVTGGDNSRDCGGLCGQNMVGGTIKRCFATGHVNGSGYLGGLCGESWSTVSGCFWDIQTSDCNTSAGGKGKTTAEMKTLTTFTDAGWDFIEIWGIGEKQTYPYLRFAPAGDFNYDKEVNFLDLAILASHWLEEN